jgi:hypothetical protein
MHQLSCCSNLHLDADLRASLNRYRVSDHVVGGCSVRAWVSKGAGRSITPAYPHCCHRRSHT